MPKKVFFILIIIFLGLALFIVYLNKFILPVKLKVFIAEVLTQQTNRKVSLGDVKYNLLKGLVLKDLTIYDEQQEKSFLFAKEVSFNFLFLPLLKQRKIIIPSLNIDTVKFNLQRKPDATWNISGLAFLDKNRPKPKIRLSILIYKINITRIEGLFQDQAVKPVFNKKIKELDIRAALSLNQSVKFNSILKLESLPQDTYILLKGVYNLKDKSLSAVINTKNITLNDYLSYLSTLPISINEGNIPEAKIDFSLKNKSLLSLKSNAVLKNINVSAQQYNLTGDGELDFNLKSTHYSGGLNILKANLTGVPQINSLNNLSGKINFSSQKIEIVKLKGLALNCPVEFNGTITNFTEPLLNLNIVSDIDLIKLKDFIAKKIENAIPEGKAVLNMDVQYALKNNILKGYKGELDLFGCSSFIPSLNEKVTNLNAKVDFADNKLHWHNTSFDFKNTKFSSQGSVINFQQPVVDLELACGALNLKSKFNLQDKTINLSSLNGALKNSIFEIKGIINLDPPDKPFLNLSGNTRLDLADIKNIPFLSEKTVSELNKFNPDGLLEANLSLKGRLSDWRNLNLDVDANSKFVSVSGIKFENPVLNYKQKDTLVNVFKVAAKFYNGDLNLDGNARLEDEGGASYALSLNLDKTELAKLKNDTPLKDKDISGVINLSTQITGKGRDTSTIRGQGRISLADGKIWEIGPFKGLMKYLFLPEFRKSIIFKEGAADFIIKNKYVFTDNLYLNGPDLNLTAQGKVGFSGNLDFRVNTEFKEGLEEKRSRLSKKIRPILNGVGKFLTIKVTGNVSDPKFSVMPAVTPDIFKKIESLFKDKIK